MNHTPQEYDSQQLRDLCSFSRTPMYEHNDNNKRTAHLAKPLPMTTCATPKMSDVHTSAYIQPDVLFDSDHCIALPATNTATVPDVYTPPAAQSSSDLAKLVDSAITPVPQYPALMELNVLKLPESVSEAQTRPSKQHSRPAPVHSLPSTSYTTSEVTARPSEHFPSPLTSTLSSCIETHLPSSECVDKILQMSRTQPVQRAIVDKLFNQLCADMKSSAKEKKLQLRAKLKDEAANEQGSSAQISSRREAKVSRELKTAYKDLCENQLHEAVGIILNLYAALQQHIDIPFDDNREEAPIEQPRKKRKHGE